MGAWTTDPPGALSREFLDTMREAANTGMFPQAAAIDLLNEIDRLRQEPSSLFKQIEDLRHERNVALDRITTLDSEIAWQKERHEQLLAAIEEEKKERDMDAKGDNLDRGL